MGRFARRRPLQQAGCALLSLTLALQLALGARHWLAARQPALAGVLRALAHPLGLRVQPYRHIDAIVIDYTGLTRSAADSFQFHYSLRNRAGLPVATPALELTLTDAQGRPLVRRVVSATELGAPDAIAAHSEHSGARTLALARSARPAAVTDYTVEAFYP